MLGLRNKGYFSEDMKWICQQEGLTLAEAFKKSLEAMDPEFAQLHNFKALANEIAPLDRIQEGLETQLAGPPHPIKTKEIKRLLSKLKWQGFDYFTPNDLDQLLEILTIASPQTITN